MFCFYVLLGVKKIMYAKNKVEKLKKKPRYSERFNDGSKIHNKNKKTKRQHVKEKEEDFLYEEW